MYLSTFDDTARSGNMAQSIQPLAKGDEALRDWWEQFCTSGASKHDNEDSGEDDISHDLVDFERCDDCRRNAFTASAIVIGDVCDWVQESPDEQEGSKNTHTGCG